MKHRASRGFWERYRALPEEIRRLADANFKLLKSDSRHPSLHFKKIGSFCSARVGLHYRALGVQNGDELVWFWIGHHQEYDKLIGGTR